MRHVSIAGIICIALISLTAAAPPAPESWKGEELPKLSDQALYDQYLADNPKIEEDDTARQPTDYGFSGTSLFWEVLDRGRTKWAAFVKLKEAAVAKALADLSDGGLFVLLRGLPEFGHDAVETDRMNAVTAEAVRRKGRLLEYAIRFCPASALQTVDDKRLAAELHAAFDDTNSITFGGRYEPILNEILRRGGAQWEAILTEEAKRPPAFQRDVPLPANPPRAIEALSTLRRLQSRLDPLQILVEGRREAECIFPALPTFNAVLVNLDSEHLPVRYQSGGDYRSGRLARWTLWVTDGNRMSVAPREWFGFGGGLSTDRILEFGESIEVTLSMRDYIESLPPGRYIVRILYHNQIAIADRKLGGKGLICCESDPIALTVKAGTIRLTPAARKEIGGWLGKIDEESSLKIVAGTYGDWAKDLVAPESPQGRLLASGLAAVPVLLDSLDSTITPARRALVLGLLFSLTGQNDPRHVPGVLPPYDAWSGPWSIFNEQGGGFGMEGREHWGIGEVSPAAQEEFAKRWKVWRNYILVEDK